MHCDRKGFGMEEGEDTETVGGGDEGIRTLLSLCCRRICRITKARSLAFEVGGNGDVDEEVQDEDNEDDNDESYT